MNAYAKALAAYAAPSSTQKSPRAVEYDVFARVTAQLRNAIAGGRSSFPALVEALNANRRLWTELAVDLASDGNQLPVELRANLLGLANFILKHGQFVLRGEAEADILVDLNVAVMRGLSGHTGTTDGGRE